MADILDICVAAFLWKIEKMRKFACIVAVVRDMGITSTKLALYMYITLKKSVIQTPIITLFCDFKT